MAPPRRRRRSRADKDELVTATRLWLEELRTREPGSAVYGPDLGLTTVAQQLVDDDRRRDGVVLHPGQLDIRRLDAHDSGLVDLEATITYPEDSVAEGRAVAPSRVMDEVSIELGAAYWTPGEVGGWQLVDYVRNERRMSASWCTHPRGEDTDLNGGLAAVAQAITVDGPKAGRIFLEVQNEREQSVVLRVGRPPRPRGILRRSPPVTMPEIGIPVPPGGATHLLGRTARPKLTEVELFAFDPVTGQQVAELQVLAELPRKHPGGDGIWCADASPGELPDTAETAGRDPR
jgi:hypothetical protein